MSTTIPSRLDETPELPDSAGVARSEPVGRAQRRAGAARRPDPRPGARRGGQGAAAR